MSTTRVLTLSAVPILVLFSGAACRKAPASPASSATASTPAPAAPAQTAQPGQAIQPGQAAQPAPSAPPGQPAAEPPPKPVPTALPAVIAKVNGEAIESWELESAVKQVEARAGSQVTPDQRDGVYRGVIEQLVTLHLLAQEGHARKFDVPEADINTRMAAIRQGFPTEEAYQQGLLLRNLTVDHLRRQTRMSLQAQKLVDQEVNSKVMVQDGEVDAFYKQNMDRFKEDESVHASHILIAAPENSPAAQKTEARAKAVQLLKDIKAGKDFATLAKENSQDPGSADKGGDLGFFTKGQMVPAFDAAAFKLKPGAVSDVIETPFGFHILKVHEKRAPRTVPLAEAGPEIKEYLTEGQRQAKLQQFVDQIKAKSKIQVLV